MELPGSRPHQPLGFDDLGAWAPAEAVEVSLLLRRGVAGPPLPSIDQLGAVPIRRRSFLGREEFARRYSARSADVDAVRGFAERSGLTVRRVETVRRAITLSGPAREIGAAFGVELLRFGRGTASYRSHDGPLRLPAELLPIVRGVFGLDGRPALRPHFRRNTDPHAVGYAVTAVGAAYDFPAAQTGAGQTIGLLEFGGGYSPSDLTRYFAGAGVAEPTVVAVGLDGAANAPTGDPNGPDAEVELDIEIAGTLAPGATIVVYFAPNTEQGFADALTGAVHDSTHRPEFVSVSWGGPEESWSTSARAALEDAAQDGASQGVTVLAASGDQGASDGEPAGTLAVDFPASSPYVVGCGGTRLELSGTTIVSEVVWNDLAENEGASGGGVSELFPRPTYQRSANVPLAPDGDSGRGVPDVAADADPETGYAVFVDGAPAVIGGTSAAAPLWAALLARCAQGLGQALGFVNPPLYAAALAAAFRGITHGSNGGYSAGPGWNPCTGLGSPHGAALLSGLESVDGTP